jgi:ABC-type Na+ efflux pump permease subunit
MVGFQVALGLLLLSVGAATSLAEERVRGSLDVLLSTPMSTRSILAGKWWGTFRQVGPVLFWPALLGLCVLLEDGSWLSYLWLLLSVVAYVAAITSLGLAMATWVGRLGRAVALCVTIYVAFSIAWPFLIASLCRPDNVGHSLIIGSPAVGAGVITNMIWLRFQQNWREAVLIAAPTWVLIYVGAAWALFAATRRTFDRCLGRMPETESPPRTSPETVTTERTDYAEATSRSESGVGF